MLCTSLLVKLISHWGNTLSFPKFDFFSSFIDNGQTGLRCDAMRCDFSLHTTLRASGGTRSLAELSARVRDLPLPACMQLAAKLVLAPADRESSGLRVETRLRRVELALAQVRAASLRTAEAQGSASLHELNT